MTETAVLTDFAGKGFGAFKPALADLTVTSLAPISARFNTLRSETAFLDSILAEGADRAAAIADAVRREVYDIVGFLQR